MPFAGDPFVTQPRLRRKCVKLKYQIAFWTIMAIHQDFTFGFLQRWELPIAILRAIRSVVNTATAIVW